MPETGSGPIMSNSSSAERSASRRGALAALALLPAALSPFPARAQASDRLGVPGPIVFGDRPFALAWSAQPHAGYVKQEYLPAGQALPSYETMLLVEVLDGAADVKAAVSAQVGSLQPRRGKDPIFNMQVLQKESAGEVLLDFLISGRSADGRSVAEWNGYRYLPLPGRGVMLFAVSHRGYGDGIKPFLTGLKQLRPAEISRLAAFPVPRPRG